MSKAHPCQTHAPHKGVAVRLGLSLLLSFTLLGCTNPRHSSELTGILPEISWLNYDDNEAADLAQQCRIDFTQANRQFQRLKNLRVTTPIQFLEGLNQLHIAQDSALGKSSLYRNVHPSADVRNAANECFQNFYALKTETQLSVPLYQKIKRLNTKDLPATDLVFVEKMIAQYERLGVGLDQQKRQALKLLDIKIRQLGQEFSQNIREDERKIALDDPALLKGLPQDFIDAHPANDKGQIHLTTNYPDYHPVMRYAENDRVRLELYKLFRKRGYPQNGPVLKKLLQARHQYAQILGYSSFAEFITADQMIGSATEAQAFLDKLNALALPAAAIEYDTLLQQLHTELPEADSVGDWQKAYLEEKVRQQAFQVSVQDARQYFHYDKVKNGLFQLTEALFNVRIRPWRTEAWHPEVQSYAMWRGSELIGRFYMDMHPRSGKYKHAAAFGVQDGALGIQPPITALVCNFPEGLMEHSQVETFFHEFGHLLHSMFGGHQKYIALSGIKTERDFVEAPSQMLEEWMWDAKTLQRFALNSRGEPIPLALVEKLNKARHYGKALYTRHQIFYAALSLHLYNQPAEGLALLPELKALQAKYSPYPYVEDTFFYTNFGHLYGYSAIYYSYLWSKVIAADMFSLFKEQGLFNRSLAERYINRVLAPGGSIDAEQLVSDFLERPYNIEAFINSFSPQPQ